MTNLRILLLANNRLGAAVAERLRAGADEIVGVVLHPPERRKFGDEILRAVGCGRAPVVLDATRLAAPECLETIRNLSPEIGVSVLFGYKLRPELLEMMPRGCVNLHPALLPYNRGAHPNVWSLVEGTPCGVTLHYMDAGIDTGDIIAQREVDADPADTGRSLYEKLERAALELFRDTWPLIRAGNAPRTPQPIGGSHHRVRDLDRLDEIELDRQYTGRQLIDILRARTFPPYRGAYFRTGGRRVYVSVQLRDEALDS